VAKRKPEQGDDDSSNDNPVLPGGLIPAEQWPWRYGCQYPDSDF
jgi:hypothetical protein